MSKAPHVELKRFDFINNELTLELTAASSKHYVCPFTHFLVQQGLSVKQQNASLAGSRVNAMLVIS